MRIVVGDQDPAQGPSEFAWWTAQRVRQAWEEKFGIVLSVSPVRRSLRRLRLPPQRRQRRATKYKPADVQRGRPRVPQDPSPCPGFGSLARLRRRVRPGCTERVRTHWEPSRSASLMRVASGRFRLNLLAASSPEGQL